MDYSLLGKNIIKKTEPAGKNVRDDTVYDELQQVLDKLSSPALRDQFDWKDVVGPCAIILKSYSKDLLVACYLGIALTNVHKTKGLLWSVGLLNNILDTFWEDLFPLKKRFRGRISAVEYWIDQTNMAFDAGLINNIKPEESEALLNGLDQIKSFLTSKKKELKIEEIDKVFEFSKLISEIKNRTEKEEAVPQKAKAADKASDMAQAAINPETMSLTDIKKYLSKTSQNLKLLTRKIRLEDPTNPMPYKWARMCAWDLLEALPPADGVKTKIKNPPEQPMNLLEKLYKEGDWKNLLEQSEIKITNPQYMFCLDISRYSSQALINLGDNYQAAAVAVNAEVLNFVSRFPGIVKYEFSGGTPFVSSESQRWINGLKNDQGSESGSQIVLNDKDSNEHSKLNELISGATDHTRMKTNIAEIQKLIIGSGSEKSAFINRMGLINVLLNNKKIEATVPHLEKILKEIEEFRIEKWEPDLALAAFSLAIKIYNSADPKKYKEKINTIVDQVSLINTTAALAYY